MDENGTATIRDVARAAGVSFKTVARVINKEPHVRPEKRERVLSAMLRHGYVPNVLAQEFAAGASRVVGLCFLNRGKLFSKEYYFSEMFDAAHHMLDSQGYYSLFVAPEVVPEDPTGFLLDTVRQRKLAGLMVADLVGCDMRRFEHAGVPTVFLSRRYHGKSIASVTPDNAEGIGQAVRHLHGLGHRRIGYFGYNPVGPSSRERHKAFVRILARLDLRYEPSWNVVSSSEDPEDIRKAIQPIVDTAPGQRPTAFCCNTDILAVLLTKELGRYGLQVPGDISLVGFDDEDFCRLATPALTTVRVPRADMGRLAAERLMKMVTEGAEGNVAELPVTLVVRESTAAAPVERGGSTSSRGATVAHGNQRLACNDLVNN